MVTLNIKDDMEDQDSDVYAEECTLVVFVDRRASNIHPS